MIRTLLDRASITRISAGLKRELRRGARSTLTHLAGMGVGILRRLDKSVGRDYLAGQWTSGGVRESGLPGGLGTSMWVEIYSAAENKDLNKRTGGRNRRRGSQTVRGADLIAMLNYGTAEHQIMARPGNAGRGMLVWPDMGTERFLGSAMRKGEVIGRFEEERGGTGRVVVAPMVNHPGFGGSHFLQRAADVLRAEAAARGLALFTSMRSAFAG